MGRARRALHPTRLPPNAALQWGMLAIVLATLLAVPASAGAFPQTWPRVRARADSLAEAGDWPAAIALLRASRTVVREPYARAWQCREREARITELSLCAALDRPTRDSLAAASGAVRASQRAVQRDSIALAHALAERALALRLRVLGPDHEATAEAQLVLAQAEFLLARIDGTDSLAEAALRTFRRRLGPDHPRVGDAEQLLGRNLKNFTGRSARPRVLEHYGRALRIRVAAYGPGSLEAAECFHEIGNMERLAGNEREARRGLRRALEIRRRLLGVVDHQVAATLGAMAMLRAEQGEWVAAESLVTAALAATPADAKFAPRSRAFRAGLLGQLLREQGRTAEAERWLREAIAIQESVWVSVPRDEGATMFAGFALYFELALAQAQQGRAEEAFVTLEHGTSRTLLEHTLRSGSGAGSVTAERAQALPDLAEVQRAIAPDVALVSWIETRFGAGRRGTAWACVLRSHGPPHWVRLPGSTTALPGGQLLQGAFWQEMRSASRWPWRLEQDQRERTLAREMGRAWFAPLEPWLQGVRRIVVFSPDQCGGGPLAALSDSSGRPLIERFAISYAPSARLFALGHERAVTGRGNGAALIVADPAFRPASEGGWAPLAGSRREIEAVRRAASRITVLEGGEARARSLRELARRGQLAHYSLVHFATHTAVDEIRVLESALVLAPDGPGEPESRVTAGEIAAQWRLGADLVCVSGCQSAAGMRTTWMGLMGMQQALLRAGARSVLVSMWPVDDTATALLMSEFYTDLATRSGPGRRSEALRAAQDAVRRWSAPDGSHPYAHPAYWAGFTLIGDPG